MADDAKSSKQPKDTLTKPEKSLATPTNDNLRREHMPKDFSISVDTYYRGGTDHFLLNPPTKRQQPMKGFEEEYTDVIDWIVRITHRIWEEYNVGLIYDYYRHNSRVTDDYGIIHGRETIVENTLMAINGFPDNRGYADEIIWAGNDEIGFHTSHRAVLVAHNTGYTQYGPPTNKKVCYWVIADCLSLENEIYEEWVLYNTTAVISQLGFDVFQMAREIPPRVPFSGMNDPRSGEPPRIPGLGKPPVLPLLDNKTFDVEDFVRHMFHEIWNWRLVGKVNDYYHPIIRFHGAGNREFHGTGQLRSYIMSILAMFPNLSHQIDHIYWMGNDDEGYRVSVRWSIEGAHRGPGLYGKPTGKPISMWGISQLDIRNGRILEEWTLFNEFAVIQQILAG